mmetsp:Transcript_66137/g.149300  ORF Transcript_66137/g.149300 Transcript_66137/m.149300 type:complete len:114 (-) Transcript_66137:34-375(-)
MYEHCAGAGRMFNPLQGVQTLSFQRVARKIGCPTAIADLLFVRITTEHTAPGKPRRGHLDFDLFVQALHELCFEPKGTGDSFVETRGLDPDTKGEIFAAAVEAYFEDDDDDGD